VPRHTVSPDATHTGSSHHRDSHLMRSDRKEAGHAMKGWAVFLDRDGVINEEVGYLQSPRQIRLLPEVAQAIQILNQQHVPAIVVTNQAGIARGYFAEETVQDIHSALSALLAAEGARIDRYYYCPHHPTAGLGLYRLDCECRKPKPGMLIRAATELNLDLTQSFIVGDKEIDIETGRQVGARSILVRTGYGEATWNSWSAPFQPDYVAPELKEAVIWILNSASTVALG
jgi:D-glycero-D-manno-heptose 1,7-bisphosphate phosphatase